MNTNLRTLLREKIASEGSDRVLRAMGYRASALPRAQARLRATLGDPSLGLAVAQYDFRFSNREFLRTLAEVTGVASSDLETHLRGIEAEMTRKREAFKPWIFVDTGFQRKEEPIFALAVLEGRRRLALPGDSWSLPQDQLVAAAGDRVRTHYRDCHGRLPLWGVVKEYRLMVSNTEQVVMDVCGKVIRVEPSGPIGRACIRLK